MNIEFPSNRIELAYQMSKSKTSKPKQLTKFDELRNNPTARKNLTEMLDNALEGIKIDGVLNEKITTTGKNV